MLNLWNPHHLGWLVALPTALLLGVIHGITPDEHTWPITFSYSIGSYSSRGGRRVGLLFSMAFTLQRAIASEIAYLALNAFQFETRWQYQVYLVVGVVMAFSGVYILRRGRAARWSFNTRAETLGARFPKYMPLIHGFIAGWGVGAFATILYTVVAPVMPSPWLGFVPGLLFGAGTMIMQVLLGSLFGHWMAKRRLPDRARQHLAQAMSGRTLAGGGIAFVVVALLGLLWPHQLNRLALTTPLHIHNLHTLGAGFFLAVVALFGVAVWAFYVSRREALEKFGSDHPLREG